MSFSDNLQFLRKNRGITQEQLAEKLEVSRQSVSKWESGAAYPETEKLLTMCDMFGCDMDTLMRGDVSKSFIEDRWGYDAHKTRFANAITFGVGFVLLGISIMFLLVGFGIKEELATIVFLGFVGIAAVAFVAAGLLDDRFNKEHPEISDFYTKEQKDKVEKNFIVSTCACVGLVLLGVIFLLGSEAAGLGTSISEELAGAIFMLFIAVAACIIVRASLIKAKINIREHNRENGPQTKADKISGAIHGTIWCLAVAIYLIISFTYNNWHISWLVFPVAAMLSGAAAVILQLIVKDDNEPKE